MVKWTSIEEIKNVAGKNILRNQNELSVYVLNRAKNKKKKEWKKWKKRTTNSDVFPLKANDYFGHG